MEIWPLLRGRSLRNTPDIVISYKTINCGGHEEICDKNVGHATKKVGNHWSRGFPTITLP